ncbi:hypothetical protein [Hyphobacterium sp.]|uniref:hypothetical protein n=1 Tax=Hyphobacterium sp. TaxID=2004662 RepID=UPI003B51E710
MNQTPVLSIESVCKKLEGCALTKHSRWCCWRSCSCNRSATPAGRLIVTGYHNLLELTDFRQEARQLKKRRRGGQFRRPVGDAIKTIEKNSAPHRAQSEQLKKRGAVFERGENGAPGKIRTPDPQIRRAIWSVISGYFSISENR